MTEEKDSDSIELIPSTQMPLSNSSSSTEKDYEELSKTEMNSHDVDSISISNGLNEELTAEINDLSESHKNTDTDLVPPEILDGKINEEPETEVIEEIQPRTEEEIQKSINKLVLEIDTLSVSTLNLDTNMEVLGGSLEEKIRVRDNLQEWHELRKGSYAWKLMNELTIYRSILETDEKKLRDFAASESELKEGFGEATRKWFMKRFWRNFTISWFTLLLLYLVNRFSDQISTFLANLFGGRSFLKMGLDFALRNALGFSLRRVIGAVLGISFLHFISLLFAFYRRNWEHSQLVAKESAAATAMENGIEKVKNGRERIDSLHPQVPQFIEVLSLGLHNPWKINSSSLLFTGSVPNTTILPASVEVAVPTIVKKSAKYEELVMRTLNKIQIPGWRDQAFNEVIQELADSIGFGANNMAVRELDEDQRKSGKRQLLITAGKDSAPAEKIGVSKVERFTKVTQEEVLPFAQPQVVSLRPNPLEGLELEGSIGFNAQDGVSKWEVYLSEIADLASPWSTSTFSSLGQGNSKHIDVESIFISSEQVNALTKPGVIGEVAVRPGARPFEVAIRVDLSDWCKPDEVAIFSDFTATPEQIERWSRGGSTHGVTLHSDLQVAVIPPGPEGVIV